MCISRVHEWTCRFRVRGNVVSQEWVLFFWLPVELSDSDHGCAFFFWWLFRLFPMVTPYPTTTAMLKGALKRVTWHECRSMRPQKTSFSPELNFLQKSPALLWKPKLDCYWCCHTLNQPQPPAYRHQHTRKTTQNKPTNTFNGLWEHTSPKIHIYVPKYPVISVLYALQ